MWGFMVPSGVVFPAYAGVSPIVADLRVELGGLPRLRGGEPGVVTILPTDEQVFPAYAGVSPSGGTDRERTSGLPRLRGGEPYTVAASIIGVESSPPTRG